MSFVSDLRLALGGASLSEIPAETYSKLEALERLLCRWAAKLDLIGFQTGRERMGRYFAEPLVAARWLPPAGSALDIGSGGGSPGIPFAIVRPEISWTFLEPRRRRRLFLEETVRELGLVNVRVEGRRFGETAVEEKSAISMRGVRLVPAELEAVGKALGVGGRFLWLSGEERLREASARFQAPGFAVEGPLHLLSGSFARLLVVSRVF